MREDDGVRTLDLVLTGGLGGSGSGDADDTTGGRGARRKRRAVPDEEEEEQENGRESQSDARRRQREERAAAVEDRRRAAAAARADAQRMRQEETARRRVERTKAQVRAQALKLTRRFREAGLRVVDDDRATTGGDAAAAAANTFSTALQLRPIVQKASGELAIAGGGGGGGELFEQSFHTLQEIARAPPGDPRRGGRRRDSGGARDIIASAPVVDAGGSDTVLRRLPEVGGGGSGMFPPQSQHSPAQQHSQQHSQSVPADLLPGVPVPRAPLAPCGLPGIAIGPRARAVEQLLNPPPPLWSSNVPPPRNDPHAPLAFGALRGGTLPTYRQLTRGQQHQQQRRATYLELSEDQRREQARLERELQDLAVAKQYDALTRLYNSLPEARRAPTPGAAVAAPRAGTARRRMQARHVPQQRRTVRRVFRVGRTAEGLSMLTHSSVTRASVDDLRLKMNSLSTDKMRRALMAASLLRAGSQAPEPLVRRMYQQHKMIVGDLTVVAPPPLSTAATR